MVLADMNLHTDVSQPRPQTIWLCAWRLRHLSVRLPPHLSWLSHLKSCRSSTPSSAM